MFMLARRGREREGAQLIMREQEENGTRSPQGGKWSLVHAWIIEDATPHGHIAKGGRKKRMKGRKEAGAIAVTLAGERKKGERVREQEQSGVSPSFVLSFFLSFLWPLGSFPLCH